MKKIVSGSVTLFVPDGVATEIPDGVERSDWQPEGLRGVAHGRGGAGRIAWGDANAFWRPFRHGGVLAAALGDGYVSTRPLRREIEDALRLRECGVDVPAVYVGRAERRAGRWRLALVSEYLEGRALADALEDAAGRTRRQLLADAGRVVGTMHEAGFVHPDLHPGNLFVVGDVPEARIYVLDLTGGRWGLCKGDARALRSLVRCARWWHKHRGGLPALRDVVAFLRGYTADAGERRRLLERGARDLSRALAVRRRRPG